MSILERLQNETHDYLAEHVVLQDAAHRILWLNDAAARSTGRSRDEIIGRTCFGLWPARSTPCPDCPVTEALDTDEVCRREMQTPNGRIWLITGIPVREGARAPDRVIEITRDITDLREMRRELADRSASLQSLFDNSRDPVYVTTRSGRFVSVNQAMVDLFEYSRNDLMGLTATGLYADPDERARFQNAIDRDGSVKDFPVHLVARDGRTLDCLLTSSARCEDGRVVGYQGIIRDVTRDRLFTRSIQSALNGTIAALGQTVEMRDSYTSRHQRRVTELAVRIADRLALSDDDVECVRVAGLMHDIGKLSVPAEILAKPSRLTDTEFGIIQQHPQTAYEILSPVDFPWPVATIILQHHERLDGSGYPGGLGRQAIDLKAQVLAVADVVEAMAAHRPYRPALGIDAALEEIRTERGTLYDVAVADACIELFDSREFSFTDDDRI